MLEKWETQICLVYTTTLQTVILFIIINRHISTEYIPNTCLNILCGHQIQEKLKALQEEKETLSDNWQSKQKWLENTYLEQVFYRDTEHMEKITNSQEVSAPVN